MVVYTTKEGDVFDWICWKHYGTTAVLETVLKANPDVTDYTFSAGIIVNLPVIDSIENKRKQMRLWT
jgi:phage tail protein X